MRASIVILILVVRATSASAECAWVLWLHWPGGPVGVHTSADGYEVAKAFLSRQECEHEGRQLVATGLVKPGGGNYDSYACLPDTVSRPGPGKP